MNRPLAPRTRRLSNAGFTLVELMIVVAMVGILAALALAGYRKYVDSAKIAEPQQVVQGIRAAEEQYRAEMMSYLNVTSANSYYPQGVGANGKFNDLKWSWQYPTHPDYNAWMTLGVTVDAPVWFGYMVNSGTANQAVTVTLSETGTPAFPAAPTEPWYVIQAEGNPSCYATMSTCAPNVKVVGSSFTGELWMQNN